LLTHHREDGKRFVVRADEKLIEYQGLNNFEGGSVKACNEETFVMFNRRSDL